MGASFTKAAKCKASVPELELTGPLNLAEKVNNAKRHSNTLWVGANIIAVKENAREVNGFITPSRVKIPECPREVSFDDTSNARQTDGSVSIAIVI